MANEAKVFAEGADKGLVRQFTVADGTAIAKGTLLVDTGTTRTGVAHTAATTAAPLGFATMSKEASDGITEIGCQRTGVVDAVADGAIRTGQLIIAGQTTANRVQALPNLWLSTGAYTKDHQVIGRALENIADGGVGRIALSLG